ncbi:hypothetical protein U9M48_014956 [Paspalum notatum var. saurae]|uniref:Generative cell specific-1/HAP2 domain-containing protein n=1 Tax=Paspalum notatum var. saurae TaxID=547442 RepID=A0AAQ3T334_PASNO
MPPLLPVVLLSVLLAVSGAGGVEILAKSRVESCVEDSGAVGHLSCHKKLVVDMAVPSGTSGGEASLVVREVEENDTQTGTIRGDPPVITVSKSDEFALYGLTYLTDVAYKPEEQFVKTRKCEPDADADVVQICERLRYENGSIIAYTEPVCCPCGDHSRVSSSCGNFINTIAKGKANTAHCLRFLGDWFHVWEIGTRSLGFSVKVQVNKKGSVSEVVVGPENRTVVSTDNFLRVNLLGEFGGYTDIPSFEDFYLVTPSKGAGTDIGDEYSKWMLLERVLFTIDHLECDKIGVSYKAFQNQPNFCTMPFQSCLSHQLWNFWETDQTRINEKKQPLYVVQGRFQRINQHPVHANLKYYLIRSPGKIVGINVSTFQALSQVGTANVTTKNIGNLEASYSLTFNCSSGISPMEEQSYIMKPDEATIRSFSLHPSLDKAATYQCTAILKASDYSELDKEHCNISVAATVFDNGTQIGSLNDHKRGGIWGFFDTIETLWLNFWDSVIGFLSGKSCRAKCSSLFDFSCQYVCIGWFFKISLLLAALPAGMALLRLLRRGQPRHKKGHHHRHSHRLGDQPHRHHHADHQRRHHVLHRHDGEQHREAAAEDQRHHRHDPALGVQHRESGHKHRRHGKVVAPALRLGLDGPTSRPRGALGAPLG